VVDDQQAHDGCARAAGHAGREVDVAEQQHRDERHREDDDRTCLRRQVGHVEVREEPVVGQAEHDEQHDEAEDRGKRPHVAAAHALHVGLDGVAKGVGLREVVGETGLLRVADDVSHVSVSPRSGGGGRGLGHVEVG
jgi:hypothetical protein